jgi:hypothetical protein
MPNPLQTGAPPPPPEQTSGPANGLQVNAPAANGAPQAAQQLPPPPSHEQTVAALRHFDAIKGGLQEMLKDPAVGRSDVKDKIIDGMTKLVAERMVSAPQAVQQLSQVPSDPIAQRKWLTTMLQQTVQAENGILDHYGHDGALMPDANALSALYPQPPQNQNALASDPSKVVGVISALQDLALKRNQFDALSQQPAASLQGTQIANTTAQNKQNEEAAQIVAHHLGTLPDNASRDDVFRMKAAIRAVHPNIPASTINTMADIALREPTGIKSGIATLRTMGVSPEAMVARESGPPSASGAPTTVPRTTAIRTGQMETGLAPGEQGLAESATTVSRGPRESEGGFEDSRQSRRSDLRDRKETQPARLAPRRVRHHHDAGTTEGRRILRQDRQPDQPQPVAIVPWFGRWPAYGGRCQPIDIDVEVRPRRRHRHASRQPGCDRRHPQGVAEGARQRRKARRLRSVCRADGTGIGSARVPVQPPVAGKPAEIPVANVTGRCEGI